MNGRALLTCGAHDQQVEAGELYRNDTPILLYSDCKRPQKDQIGDYTFLKVVDLPDCANIFTDVENWPPRSVGKLTSLSLCFIRDVLRSINFSFLGDAYNVADTST